MDGWELNGKVMGMRIMFMMMIFGREDDACDYDGEDDDDDDGDDDKEKEDDA